MFSLRLRMMVATALLFAIMYAIIAMVSARAGISNFYFYLILSIVIMLIQYMMGPKIVEWSMKVKYIKDAEYPELHRMIKELAVKAKVHCPRIGIAQIAIPNAFAFGRSVKDGRICVTEGILNLLKENELKAVLAHEMSHIKNRDVLTITLLSVIPMILYRIAWQFLFFNRRSRGSGANTALIGMAAFIFYFITNLLVLYASRIREYFADKGSVDLGSRPADLASALYKLVYGSARMPKEALKDVEGMKAFFANDPSRAMKELKDLRDLDLDKNGTIDSSEMLALQNKGVGLSFGDRLMEIMSTHPNMLKRIKRLSEWKAS
ncbi:MAG: M48 family metalloprotease [Candidatus Omnitrophica bacterium]|nr:M48 family metalloprotease [Candidatus Omnitrophota bacterium]